MGRSALLHVMIVAASKAAKSLRRDFNEIEKLQVSIKGPGDFVSNADHKAESIIHEELSRARPDYGFLMEEGGKIIGKDAEHRWIIDPLDGTTNFLHGIPHFAISIAAEHRGQVVAGVIYNPITDEMFTAEKGKGAYLNEKQRLRVASRRELNQSIVVCGMPHIGRGDHELFLKEAQNVMSKASALRRYGAASLDMAWIAAGRFDGYWERDLGAWDLAAGTVIVREAGGFVTDCDGGNDMLTKGNVIAGNTYIREQLHKAL